MFRKPYYSNNIPLKLKTVFINWRYILHLLISITGPYIILNWAQYKKISWEFLDNSRFNSCKYKSYIILQCEFHSSDFNFENLISIFQEMQRYQLQPIKRWKGWSWWRKTIGRDRQRIPVQNEWDRRIRWGTTGCKAWFTFFLRQILMLFRVTNCLNCVVIQRKDVKLRSLDWAGDSPYIYSYYWNESRDSGL